MPPKTRVLILNGTSSAGKSSLANALQRACSEPFLHIKMDTFLEMMPPRYANHPEAFHFNSVAGSEPPEVEVRSGPYGNTVMRGMRACVSALATEGLNLIVDDVFWGDEQYEYLALLSDVDVHFIQVRCDLEIAESRELARGDRDVGLVRWQFDRVHRNTKYDFVVDTSNASPDQCATEIAYKLKL